MTGPPEIGIIRSFAGEHISAIRDMSLLSLHERLYNFFTGPDFSSEMRRCLSFACSTRRLPERRNEEMSANMKRSSLFLIHLRRKDNQPRIIAMRCPHAATGDQVQMMFTGWAKNGIDHILAGSRGRVSHYPFDHELK